MPLTGKAPGRRLIEMCEQQIYVCCHHLPSGENLCSRHLANDVTYQRHVLAFALRCYPEKHVWTKGSVYLYEVVSRVLVANDNLISLLWGFGS